MTLIATLAADIPAVRAELDHLGPPFTSHLAIERIAHRWEPEYVTALAAKGPRGAHQQLHADIGRFLERHHVELGIEQRPTKEPSRTVFGDTIPTTAWQKV